MISSSPRRDRAIRENIAALEEAELAVANAVSAIARVEDLFGQTSARLFNAHLPEIRNAEKVSSYPHRRNFAEQISALKKCSRGLRIPIKT